MVATRIHCIVVEIPVGSDGVENRLRPARDLMPETDPYIASLIRKLQDEVRQERAATKPSFPVNRLNMLKLSRNQPADNTNDTDFDQDWPLLRDMQ